ncbi:MAG: amidohydrolase [Pyramidobacter sp.]|nr:amidohydrolase [Pyramidobacter sp.]
MLNQIAELEKKYREKYMECYRHIHAHPEPSYHEEQTAAFVYDVLKTLPLDEIRTNVGGHGIVALLKGAAPGPCVALRADMDALNITENTGCPFASQNEGVMHACGHDAHTSILLGCVHVLCEMKDKIRGSVKFIFQPSEEMTPMGGAPGMIRDGALENPHVDAIIGLHVWPTLATGTIGVQAGAVSAASDHVKMTIKGKACHGSMPDQGADAIVASSAVIMALQPIISRNMRPRNAAVITIGTIKGGDRYNIVPDRVDLDGTVRSFDEEDHKNLPKWIERAAVNAAAAYGCTAEIDYQVGFPSTINDARLIPTAREAVRDILGDAGVLPDLPVPPTGEDFAFYTLQIPAAFALLGCRPARVKPEDMPALHNDKFLPDPECFPSGVKYLAATAFKLLDFIPEGLK